MPSRRRTKKVSSTAISNRPTSKSRLRDIGDVRIEIDAIDEVLPGISALTAASPGTARTRANWLPWLALAVVAAAFGVWQATRPSIIQENPLANAQFSRITDWEG